jgi:5-methylcytosine-specific restriction endonuclease McrA
MTEFHTIQPSTESYFRSIVLFGQNSSSLKFALAKSLLELVEGDTTQIRLEELAEPYSRNIQEHLRLADRQGTSRTSKFFDAYRAHNRDEMSFEHLHDRTVGEGFNIVFKAFHTVNRKELPIKFFEYEPYTTTVKGVIRLTDELLSLKESFQFRSLSLEAEARWRLVETAWMLGISSKLFEVKHDELGNQLYLKPRSDLRVNVTSARNALNGYQKGKCFYCFSEITVQIDSAEVSDVDHFFPIALAKLNASARSNLNGIWNLVLTCRRCNRGADGKFALVPDRRYVERLHVRNNFLIDSHHPLRETLIKQTGSTELQRRSFLQTKYHFAKSSLIHDWAPREESEAAF